MRNKDNALNDFLTMIYQSWTYAKLTDKEKEKMHDIIVCRSQLERARENMENALKKVKDIQKTQGIKSKAWREAWNEYKQRASDYRSFLIVHYNL